MDTVNKDLTRLGKRFLEKINEKLLFSNNRKKEHLISFIRINEDLNFVYFFSIQNLSPTINTKGKLITLLRY